MVAFPNPAKAGQTVMLSQKPANCYNFGSWSSPDVTITNNSFVMPAKDVTVTASYTIRQYTVSVAPNNPSYGTVTGSNTYDCDSTATLTAEPNTGYTFVGWYESGSQVSTTATYTFTVNDNHTLEARFNAIPYTITVNKNQAAGGSPTASPNPATYEQTVTLSANPASCYNFSSWSSSDATLASTTASVTTFTMPAKNVTATANYTIKTSTINASAGAGGSISPSGQTTVDCGSSKTYTITPSAGYVIDSVIVDGINVGAVPSYKFDNVTGDHTIVANFRLKYIQGQIRVYDYTTPVGYMYSHQDFVNYFNSNQPAGTRTLNYISFGERRSDTYWVERMEGYIYISNSATYWFYTDADDNSEILIDGQLVAASYGDCAKPDGAGRTHIINAIYLSTGYHSITIIQSDIGGRESIDNRYSSTTNNPAYMTDIPMSIIYSDP